MWRQNLKLNFKRIITHSGTKARNNKGWQLRYFALQLNVLKCQIEIFQTVFARPKQTNLFIHFALLTSYAIEVDFLIIRGVWIWLFFSKQKLKLLIFSEIYNVFDR